MTLDYDNIIDADGHILEPADTWERYIDPAYRDRALRIRTLEGRDILEMNGKSSRFYDVHILTVLGGMGKGAKEIGQMMAALPLAPWTPRSGSPSWIEKALPKPFSTPVWA